MNTFAVSAFEYLDGKKVTYRGMVGTLKHVRINAIYPYRHVKHDLYWEPSASAKRTEEYQKTRRELGDDWSTCLTDSDVWCKWLPKDFQA